MQKRYVHNFSVIENNADLAGYIVNYVVQCTKDELLQGNQEEPYCKIAREVLREVDCKATAMKPELGRIIEDCMSSQLIKLDTRIPVDVVDVKDLNSKFHVEPAEYYAMKAVIATQNDDLNDLKNLIIQLTKERLELQQELNSLKGACPRDAIC